MVVVVADLTDSSDLGTDLLRESIQSGVPIVGIFGQQAGWTDQDDPVLRLALTKLGRPEDEGWRGLLSKSPLPENFDSWLEERFARRVPSSELVAIADAPLSAVFTSSIDPGWANLLTVGGREPEPILIGDPLPPISRSKRRPPIFFLFGRAGPGPAEARPPTTLQTLAQRRLRHAGNMLRNVNEVATPVGLIVVEGYSPRRDWLKAEDLLAMLSGAPMIGVLWCGESPDFEEDEQAVFDQLIDDRIIIREERSFAALLSEIRATSDFQGQTWDDPDLISLPNGKQLITTPRLRLTTQASATIIDDSITGFIPPLAESMIQSAFESFHSIPSSVRARIDGVRRLFAIERDFEKILEERVKRALRQHHREIGGLVLHGQSGSGKSIALARLAVKVRQENLGAVLFASERLPSPADLSAFLSEVDQLEATTLIIVDVPLLPNRFDELLEALRSRGHRAVVLGTSYRIESNITRGRDRFIEAPNMLSTAEQNQLNLLASKHTVIGRIPTNQPYALASFYWHLPGSRRLLAQGLGREARASQVAIAKQGARVTLPRAVSAFGLALIKAGYSDSIPLIEDVANASSDLAGSSSAAKVIDYIMATARLFKAVPVNLVIRAVLHGRAGDQSGFDLEVVRDIFQNQDLFRWHYADEHGEELLVGARLQLEAELICNSRLSGPTEEVARLIELISQCYRAGAEGHEETKFVIDIVYALGPDGPFNERYKDSYAEVARTLTALREKNGVLNARLMLQESTLRRHYIRTHELDQHEKEMLLDEATKAVDQALQLLAQTGARRLYASRKTQEHLWVERAATYGYLATDAAQRNASAAEVWSSYRAARTAGRMAMGRVDSYFPLDIALWMPLGVLRDGTQLGELEHREIEADIQAILDVIDPSNLPADQAERFQRQRFNLGHVLDDQPLSEEAFQELERLGSTAGYYLRARQMAPTRSEKGEVAAADQIAAAERTRAYLWSNFEKVRSDPRCLVLLLHSEWLAATKRWLFRGTRQPLPSSEEVLRRVHAVLVELLGIGETESQPRYRYLEAVMRWLTGGENEAIASWRRLAADTEYVERGRVLNRHTLYSDKGMPRVFAGVVERQIGASRWSIMVNELRRRVDLADSKSQMNMSPGQALSGFGISFNYIGPIADFNIENIEKP